MKYTNQPALSAAFWRDNPAASRRKIDGMFCTDTRCAFVDYVDAQARAGNISQALAQRATLKPPPPRFYINRRGDGYRETVDEFETRKEARAMLPEYRMSDPAGYHWVSSRPCGDWEK